MKNLAMRVQAKCCISSQYLLLNDLKNSTIDRIFRGGDLVIDIP